VRRQLIELPAEPVGRIELRSQVTRCISRGARRGFNPERLQQLAQSCVRAGRPVPVGAHGELKIPGHMLRFE
jgi:hypothetical protein